MPAPRSQYTAQPGAQTYVTFDRANADIGFSMLSQELTGARLR